MTQSSSKNQLFRIKICGVTRAADAELAAQLGADAIGLNCYGGSSRFLSLLAAREVRDAVPSHVAAVGVFVDAKFKEIYETAEALELDYVQLHGSERPEYVMVLAAAGIRVIRAMRCGATGANEVTNYVAECRELELGALPAAILLDADSTRGRGGTGELADWNVATLLASDPQLPPIVLAGGLKPDNIGNAIRQVRPIAVDTASGVESSPGVKDREKMAAFIAAAREQFEQLDASE